MLNDKLLGYLLSICLMILASISFAAISGCDMKWIKAAQEKDAVSPALKTAQDTTKDAKDSLKETTDAMKKDVAAVEKKLEPTPDQLALIRENLKNMWLNLGKQDANVERLAQLGGQLEQLLVLNDKKTVENAKQAYEIDGLQKKYDKLDNSWPVKIGRLIVWIIAGWAFSLAFVGIARLLGLWHIGGIGKTLSWIGTLVGGLVPGAGYMNSAADNVFYTRIAPAYQPSVVSIPPSPVAIPVPTPISAA